MENTQVSHFRVGRLLGRGGMGEVFEAVDLNLDRPVALKFVAQELAGDEDTVRRFEREARAAAALTHPHIATLYSFEREGVRPFIAMELLSGRTLRQRIARGPFTSAEALGVARDVASALALAHRRGIVHRDIKPENLMYDEHGAIKITDFGLARAAQLSRLTMTGTTLGTAAYMGPEAVKGQSSSGSDVFALGVVLYEMLAGTTPWRGDNPFAMMFAISNDPPVPLAPTRPDLPTEALEWIDRCLARDAESRPSADDVHRALARLTGAPVPPAPHGTEDLDETETQPTLAFRRPELSGAPLEEQPTLSVRRRAPGEPAEVALTHRAPTEELTAERVPGASVADRVADARDTLVAAIGGRRALERARGPRSAKGLARVLALVLTLGVLAPIVARKWPELRGARSFGEVIAVFDSRARDEAVGLNNEGLRALQAGEIERAGTLFERAAARDPANPAVALNLGTLARRRGQTARAESLYLVALKRLQPDGPADLRVSAFVNLADLDLEAENWDGAVNWLGRAAALDSSATVVNNLGYALAMGGRGREALALLSRGIERFPGQAALLKNAALAELKLGHADAARDSVERALEIDPGYLPALALRAQLSARRGDHSAALADWNHFLAGQPDERQRRDLAAELARLGVAVP